MQTDIYAVPVYLLSTSRRVSSTVSPTDAAERISDFVVEAEHLTSVYCGIPDDDDDDDECELVEDIHLPSIEKFSLRAHKLDQVTKFMQQITLGPIPVDFLPGDVAPIPFVWGLFDPLSKFLDHGKLEILKSSIGGFIDDLRANQYLHEVTKDALEPLLALKTSSYSRKTPRRHTLMTR